MREEKDDVASQAVGRLVSNLATITLESGGVDEVVRGCEEHIRDYCTILDVEPDEYLREYKKRRLGL